MGSPVHLQARRGEDGGNVQVAFGKPLKVGGVVKVHIFCKAGNVNPQETFTNKSEVSTNAGQKEPTPDPHPNTPNADYILKP